MLYFTGQQAAGAFSSFAQHGFSQASLHSVFLHSAFAAALQASLVMVHSALASVLCAFSPPVPQAPQCALAVATAARNKKGIRIFFIRICFELVK